MRQKVKEPGHIAAPVVVCSAMGSVVALVLEFLGLFSNLEAFVLTHLSGLAGVGVGISDAPAFSDIVFAVVVSGVLCAFLFHIPDGVHRGMLFLSILVLTAAVTPICAVYGIFFSSFPALVACLWGGVCSIIYIQRHTMPWETLVASPTETHGTS